MEFHVDTIGANKDDLKKAIAKALSLQPTTMTIAAHSIDTLVISDLGELLGNSIMSELKKSPHTYQSGTMQVNVATEKIIPQGGGLLLAPYIAPELLKQLVAKLKPTDIVFLPDSASELTQYISAYPNSQVI